MSDNTISYYSNFKEKSIGFKWVLFLIGFFSFYNGVFIKYAEFSIRILDLFFYFLPILIILYINKIEINKKELWMFLLLILISIVLFLRGVFPVITNELYDVYFTKFIFNRILWIPIYGMFYFIFREKAIYYFSLGIIAGLFFNSVFVFYEYFIILNGKIPDYSFLSSIGIYFDEKKMDVFNQGFIRPTGVMMDPNYTSAYSGIGILFAEKFREKSKYKNLIIIIQSLLLLVMFLLLSRTAIFSFLIVVFVFFITSNISKSSSSINFLCWRPIIILLCFLVLISIVAKSYGLDVLQILSERLSSNDSSASTRVAYLDDYFYKVPFWIILFGFGTSRSGVGFDSYVNNYNNSIDIWSPESNILTFFFEQGLFFILFYFLVTTIFFIKIKKIDKFYASIFLYVNLIGISYNFLGDRIFWVLYIFLILIIPSKNKYESTY